MPLSVRANHTLVELQTSSVAEQRPSGALSLPQFATERQVLASLAAHGAAGAMPACLAARAPFPSRLTLSPRLDNGAGGARVLKLASAADAFCAFDARARNTKFDQLAAKVRRCGRRRAAAVLVLPHAEHRTHNSPCRRSPPRGAAPRAAPLRSMRRCRWLTRSCLPRTARASRARAPPTPAWWRRWRRRTRAWRSRRAPPTARTGCPKTGESPAAT
jgi:hypothetical protein